MRVADLAVVVVVRGVESYAVPLAIDLQLDRRVCRVLHCREVPVVCCSNAEQGVHGAERYQEALAIVGPKANHVDAVVAHDVADEEEVSEHLSWVPWAVEASLPDLSLLDFYHYYV